MRKLKYLAIALLLISFFECSNFAFASGQSQDNPLPQNVYLPLIINRHTSSAPVIVLLVDPALSPFIRTGLDQLKKDMNQEGYLVVEKPSEFITPVEVRQYLSDLYNSTNRKLEGVIIFGKIPQFYQWVVFHYTNPSIPDTKEELISFQPYADLNGSFSASPGYTSPGNHPFSYDEHTGDVNWEIWVGIFPYYKGDLQKTADALNRYFVKNHLYRTGQYTLPHGYLEVEENLAYSTIEEQNQLLEMMRLSWRSWDPLSNGENAHLYVDGPQVQYSVDQGYLDLSAGIADFTVQDVHGGPAISGRLTIPWVETNPIKTAFLFTSGCSTGDIDVPDNILTSFVYSPTSMVLLAEGPTNSSGGLGINQDGFFGHNIATALSAGKNYGEAIVSHVNVPLVSNQITNREFIFGNIILIGDPTLKLNR